MPRNQTHDRYLSINDVAAQFNVSHYTVRRWISDGKIVADRLGGTTIRIRRDSLANVIEPMGPR